MAYSSLTYEIADRIGVITFTTPEKLNAVSEARLDDLEAVHDEAEADADRLALLITGQRQHLLRRSRPRSAR